MSTRFVPVLALVILFGAGCAPSAPSVPVEPEETSTEINSSSSTPMAEWTFPGVLPAEQITDKQIRLTTEKGDIVFTLFADTAPNTVSNMVYLASAGFYDGLPFHRRVEGFVIQGGDPNGNGTGGPGYKFADELADDHQYDRGIVAMANSGRNTNGSQFFIMLADYPLPKSYSIFGKVTEGLDVVDRIAVGDKMLKVTVEDVK